MEPIEELSQLVEAARAARLSPEQEARATELLKEALLGKRAALTAAIEPMVNLPWAIGVGAITGAWAQMKPTAHRFLLTALKGQTSEQSRRFRLSLSRGMFAIDVPTSLAIATAVCAAMKEAGEGTLTGKDRQAFSQVFLGKGKPWILHLPLGDLKPADAGLLIGCALESCNGGPPFSQQSLLRWIAAAGRLADLPPHTMEPLAKSIKRWQPKLKAQFKAEVPEIPEPLKEAFETPEPPPKPAPPAEPEGEQPAEPEKEQPEAEAAEVEKPEEKPSERPGKPQPQPKRGPEPKKGRGNGEFDLTGTLRQIEAHVQGLRNELNQAKVALRQKEKQPRAPKAPEDPTQQSAEELLRHNQQLVETVNELRQRLEELAADHEDMALSMKAGTEAPVTDPLQQFKTLLGIKLAEDYAEFEALGKEPPDEVFREHYRLLIEDMFKILKEHGLRFEIPE